MSYLHQNIKEVPISQTNDPLTKKIKVYESPAFTNTGLDYFGPLYVKNGIVRSKAWTGIFTCITVRSIHLELVEDMTAAQFLACLRRFVARRGKSDKIISDNAPQFKVTKNAIDFAWENVVGDPDVISYINERGINWSFIIEFWPWMGEFYERLISITKMALKKSIGKLCLTSIQLQTILPKIEPVVNSRPLVYVNNEVEHRTIITPMDFLSINARTGPLTLMIPEEEDDPNFRLKEPKSAKKLLETLKKGQKYLEHFWKIWKDDYLLSLRERSQICKHHPGIQSKQEPWVGDFVQIQEIIPRGSWKIGRIMELIKSRYEEERAAKVKKHSTKILCELLPLECDERQDSSNENTQKKITPIDKSCVEGKHENRKLSRRQTAKEAIDKIYGQYLED